jgi:hypothetical protein
MSRGRLSGLSGVAVEDDETGFKGEIMRWSPVELGVETELVEATRSRWVLRSAPLSSRRVLRAER